MANNHTRAHAKRGGELMLSSTTTDSPILPIDQIERLQTIAPHSVDWVFDQTTVESNSRRSEGKRINTLVFIERMMGLIFALLVAGGGLGAAVYCATIDQPLVASVLGGGTLVGLVTAFVAAGSKQQSRK
jgi:uncharacterized membrane protein